MAAGATVSLIVQINRRAFGVIERGVTKVTNFFMKGGHLRAAGRQGMDELGAATRPLPSSIQVDEPGTLWNPTQGEIADSRKPDQEVSKRSTSHSSPSDIAERNPPAGWEQDQGRDHGHEQGMERE